MQTTKIYPDLNNHVDVRKFTGLEDARTSAVAAGRTVVVSTALTQAESNILADWPADRTLRVETGGSIANSTAFTSVGKVIMAGGTFSGSGALTLNKYFAVQGEYQVFTGSSTVTGLVESDPLWFAVNTTPGTTNMTTAIQAAIDSTVNIINITPGTYLTDALTIGTGKTIRGAGKHNTILKNRTAGINCITPTTSSSNIAIEGITILGTDPATDNNEKGIIATSVTDLKITDCHFEKLPYSVKLDLCVRPVITTNTFYDTAGLAAGAQGTAVLFGGSTHGIISNNTFLNTNRHAIYLSAGSSYNVVDGNTITNAINTAITTNSNDDDPPNEYNIISNNTINGVTGADGRGISMTRYTQNNVVTGNAINNTSSYGIALEGVSAFALDKTIYNNIISNNRVNAATTVGIWLSNASENIITDNLITDTTGAGLIITTSGAGTGSFSVNNLVSNNMILDSSTDGISLSGAQSLTTLRNNKVLRYGVADFPYYIVTDTGLDFNERLLKDITPVSTVGTGEDELMPRANKLPGYYMGATGILKIKANGVKVGVANTKTLKLYLHSTAIVSWTLANTAVQWSVDVTIANLTAATQTISWIMNDGGTITAGATTSAISTSATRNLGFTGTCVDAGDTITQTLFLVERQ